MSLFENGKFDLVIADYGMPVMRGDGLAAAIEPHAPSQAFIMITAFIETFQPSDSPPAGVDVVLSKPFRLETLREAIAMVLPKA